MKTLVFATLFAAATTCALAAPADLAKQKNCFACHAADKKVVGPAYKDIAAKYAKDKDAVAKMALKIQKGSSGVWGPMPMPPNQVTPAEAKQLATWVMSVK